MNTASFEIGNYYLARQVVTPAQACRLLSVGLARLHELLNDRKSRDRGGDAVCG
jgi:hypothetical protein